MKIQKEKISCLLYDFIDIQKDILFNEVEVVKYKDTLKDFAINICKLIDFKDLDKKTFSQLINKDIEAWSEEDYIDYSINDGERYYRIEFDAKRLYHQPYLTGRITILNWSETGYYGYRVYFSKVTLKKEYSNAQIINGIRIDQYLNGRTVKSDTVKINRSLMTSCIYNFEQK